jgi:dihydrofolate reductase
MTSTLSVDYFSSLDMYAYGEGHSAYFGLAGPQMFDWVNEQLAGDHIMLMGATTYRAMAEIVASGDDPTFPRMAELPKIVFSSSLSEPLTWANTKLIKDDAVTAVAGLKKSATEPMRTIGSLSLSTSLLRAGLVDRLRLMVFPLILGTSGRQRLFEHLPDVDLELAEARTLDGRLQLLEYVPTLR